LRDLEDAWMNSEAAETLALEALGWLASQDDLFPAFLGATGASVDDVRGAAGDPAFLGGVLDFLLQDDAWISAFATSSGRRPTEPAVARQLLPGGEAMHWT
jgi:hypothetical protein